MPTTVRQITTAPHGHVLTNIGVWSPDARWITYDCRSAADGGIFDGTRIERVDVETGRIEVLYESRHGACCGVATCSPVDDRVVFILGPERPTPDWSYGPAHRQGVVVNADRPGAAEPLDARDLTVPFTPGALRGGSHVHVFSPDGRLVSFTYDDAVLEAVDGRGGEQNRRCVGVSLCDHPVSVPSSHARNHAGSAFSVVITEVDDDPSIGSDAIGRACEEGWVGESGYRRLDGSVQQRAVAFQGAVRSVTGETITEMFLVDLPDSPRDLMLAGHAPLEGTPSTRPRPPRGIVMRRLTRTGERRYPGIQGPRHWLRSSGDGERIACLMRDDSGVAQIFTVRPRDGAIRQITTGFDGIESAFSWSPCGGLVACVIAGRVSVVEMDSGRVHALTEPSTAWGRPRPEACVFSPDGRRIAFAGPDGRTSWNQVFMVDVPI